MDSKDIQRKIDIVTNDMLSRFPGCSYTIEILLWDDGTDCVICRHGTDDGHLHLLRYYKDNLEYTCDEISDGIMVVNAVGKEFMIKMPDEFYDNEF